MNVEARLKCQDSINCSGCPWIHLPYGQQIDQKIVKIQDYLKKYNLPKIQIKSAGIAYLRDYLDLSYRNDNKGKRLGLYSHNKKDILDLQLCHLAKPKLWQYIERFKQDMPDTPIASFRFRLSPNEDFGIWMDLPNIEIKKLLEEESWLRRINNWATIEIGQKRKRFVIKEEKLKLVEGYFGHWFTSFTNDMEVAKLNAKIGGFTQSGSKINFLLIEAIKEICQSIPTGNAIDLCCGIGNFTFPLASWGWQIEGHDFDIDSLKAANQTKQELQINNVDFIKTNIHSDNKDFISRLKTKDLVVVDPPRSGLKDFSKILSEAKVKNIIYVSCYLESYSKDIEILTNAGYEIQKMYLVDQFVQSPHIEMVTLLVYDH